MTDSITRIDELMNSAFPVDEPGASVLVADGAKVLLRKGYGLSNLELNVPVTPSTVFRIGSVTKQFTAVAILILKEQGALSLTNPLSEYIEDYPSGTEITIANLLHHTSGVRNYTAMPAFGSISMVDRTVLEMIEFFKHEPLDFEPGDQFNYSNSGYFLLGHIIELVSGQSYERFIRERIFTPLGMQHSYYDKPHRVIANRASGYLAMGEMQRNADYIGMTLPYAAGALASTIDDLHRWNLALTNNELVSNDCFDEAKQSGRLNNGEESHYGFGWCVDTYGDQRFVEHGGGINGFVCHWLRVEPADKLVVVLTNNAAAPSPINLAFKAMCELLEVPYEQPPRMENVDINQFEGNYLMGVLPCRIEANESELMLHGIAMQPLSLYPISATDFAEVGNEFNRVHFSLYGDQCAMTVYPRGAIPLRANRQT